MSFLIITSGKDPKPWVEALKEKAPDLDLEIYPEVADPAKVEFALSWRHPHGSLQRLSKSKSDRFHGSGYRSIINDPEIPKKINITRVVDEQLTKDMSVFVLSLVLDHLSNLSLHHSRKEWKQEKYLRPEEVQIGIMGMGDFRCWRSRKTDSE